jgi:hypothetical protein
MGPSTLILVRLGEIQVNARFPDGTPAGSG